MWNYFSDMKNLSQFFLSFVFLLIGLKILSVGNCEETATIHEHNGTRDFDPLLVTIPSGKLKGKSLKDKNGKEFYAFQKIPYAKKPLGSLRFKPLQKPDKWNDTLDATQVPPDCLQDKDGFSSEDCIYLNVFSHRHPDLHPVMVYIFGGALTSGSSNPETTLGPEFLLTKEIVLVTFNYRLGIFGFLNFEYPENEDIDLNSPGNQNISEEITSNNGFKDQIFALQWVQENIEYFGGDRNKVTIFGNSAGAVSVHALLLSPLTENLFHGVISQSGTAITRGLSINNSAIYVGDVLGLDTKNATKLMEGLRNLTEQEILSLQDKIDLYRLTINKPTPAGLVIEKPGPHSFMPENPWKLIQSGKYHHRPIMFGVLNSEGIIYDVYHYLKNTTRYFDINAFIPYYYHHRDIATLEIDENFFPNQNYSDIYAWIDLWGYSSFVYDIIRCVNEQMKWSDVYFYEFELDTDLNWSKMRSPEAGKLKGACHGDELGYLFKRSTTPEIIKGSPNELAIDRMVTLWTNFATYGMPIVAGIGNNSLLNNQRWLPVRKNSFNVLRIGQNLTQEVFNFTKFYYWNRFYEMYSSKIL